MQLSLINLYIYKNKIDSSRKMNHLFKFSVKKNCWHRCDNWLNCDQKKICIDNSRLLPSIITIGSNNLLSPNKQLNLCYLLEVRQRNKIKFSVIFTWSHVLRLRICRLVNIYCNYYKGKTLWIMPNTFSARNRAYKAAAV